MGARTQPYREQHIQDPQAQMGPHTGAALRDVQVHSHMFHIREGDDNDHHADYKKLLNKVYDPESPFMISQRHPEKRSITPDGELIVHLVVVEIKEPKKTPSSPDDQTEW